MDKYAVDRLNENIKRAVDEGVVPASVYTPIKLHLERRSRQLAPQTEAKEILEDIEELQCYVADEAVQSRLAGVWCRVNDLKGMVSVDG